MEEIVNYYAGGNTAKGFVHFFESNFQELERLLILKGGPGTGKSTLMKKIGKEWQDEGYAVEWIHCSADVGSVDAVIIPALKAGIVDGTSPHIIEPSLPGIVDDYVNLGVAWDREKLIPHKKNIQRVNKALKESYRHAYSYLQKAFVLFNEEKEKLKKDVPEKVRNEIMEWTDTLLPKREKEQTPVVKHRYYRAFTPDGYHHFAEDLLGAVEKRIFLTGSFTISEILENIARIGIKQGYDVHLYHHALNPDLVEMVVFPEVDVVFFDHTFFTDKISAQKTDEWITLGEVTLENKEQIVHEIEKATEFLAQTSKLRSELEGYYIGAMDFTIVDQIGKEISEELKRLKIDET